MNHEQSLDQGVGWRLLWQTSIANSLPERADQMKVTETGPDRSLGSYGTACTVRRSEDKTKIAGTGNGEQSNVRAVDLGEKVADPGDS